MTRKQSPQTKGKRADLARQIILHDVPRLLEEHERAAHGVASARLLRATSDLQAIPSPAGELGCASVNLVGTSQESDEHAASRDLSVPEIPRSALQVRVIAGDTFEVAYSARTTRPHDRIAVLNMASPLQPGGGVLRGANAQEESLCLRSTLNASLQQQWYPLPDDGVICTEDVLVFAKAQAGGAITVLDEDQMWYVDVVSCAAVRRPELRRSRNGEQYADPKDEERMEGKIRHIMRASAQMGAKVVVLGAFGCGAYGNPVAKVARMMRRCLLWQGNGPNEDWVAAGIEEVLIAILDETSEQRVWQGFKKEFKRVEGVSIHG